MLSRPGADSICHAQWCPATRVYARWPATTGVGLVCPTTGAQDEYMSGAQWQCSSSMLQRAHLHLPYAGSKTSTCHLYRCSSIMPGAIPIAVQAALNLAFCNLHLGTYAYSYTVRVTRSGFFKQCVKVQVYLLSTMCTTCPLCLFVWRKKKEKE